MSPGRYSVLSSGIGSVISPIVTTALTSPLTIACMVPTTVPFTWPLTRPSTRTVPNLLVSLIGEENLKLVFSIIFSPTISTCGRTNITKRMEIIVPLPRLSPIPLMAPLEVIFPMAKPDKIIVEPEVIIVGNAKFRVSIIASFFGRNFLSSVYLPEITIA